MKSQFIKAAIILSLTAPYNASCFANTVQTTTPASSSSYWNGNGWGWQELGSVTLAQGTNTISSLTSTVTLTDQGWGGQDGNNGVLVSLFSDSTNLYDIRVAGANHGWTTQNYDIANFPSTFSGLNSALNSINWSLNPNVKLVMNATPFAYGGWELHTQNASFSVTSSVPEPAFIAMLMSGLLGFGALRRKNTIENDHVSLSAAITS